MQAKSFSTSGHAVYSLNVHFIFVTKYRHAYLSAAMLASIQRHVDALCTQWRCRMVEFNGEADHVHLLIEMHPTVAVSALASSLKTVTARRLRYEFAQHLRAYYWKPRLWASSYAAFSVGSADLETVKRYIQNQEKPH